MAEEEKSTTLENVALTLFLCFALYAAFVPPGTEAIAGTFNGAADPTPVTETIANNQLPGEDCHFHNGELHCGED